MITCKNNRGELVNLPKEKFQFRPSVYGIIRNAGKICICHNQGNAKIWFPGGGIMQGETRLEALKREIKEETGLVNVQIGKLLGAFENFFYYEPTDEAMQAFLFFYECSTDETDFLPNEQIDDDEARDFQWIEIDQIKAEDLGDLNSEIKRMLSDLITD